MSISKVSGTRKISLYVISSYLATPGLLLVPLSQMAVTLKSF